MSLENKTDKTREIALKELGEYGQETAALHGKA